jgi:hypothetical protein
MAFVWSIPPDRKKTAYTKKLQKGQAARGNWESGFSSGDRTEGSTAGPLGDFS